MTCFIAVPVTTSLAGKVIEGLVQPEEGGVSVVCLRLGAGWEPLHGLSEGGEIIALPSCFALLPEAEAALDGMVENEEASA